MFVFLQFDPAMIRYNAVMRTQTQFFRMGPRFLGSTLVLIIIPCSLVVYFNERDRVSVPNHIYLIFFILSSGVIFWFNLANSVWFFSCLIFLDLCFWPVYASILSSLSFYIILWKFIWRICEYSILSRSHVNPLKLLLPISIFFFSETWLLQFFAAINKNQFTMGICLFKNILYCNQHRN